jgi:protease IV
MILRRFAMGLFLASLGVAPLQADDKPKAKKEADKEVIAHIRLHGDLDETPPGESPFGTSSENLRMKLERISKAKVDPKVKALFVEIDDLSLGLFGFGKVEELRHAILDFRKSGKKAYAYAEGLGGIEYLIALACDVVCIPESGEFSLLGLRIETSFYKETFDKIGVKADFLTMGEAKGAADPYIRTNFSPENRKQYEMVIDDLFDNGIVSTMIASRPEKKWTSEQVKKVIDEAPYAGKKALELGLVDRISYRDAFEESILKESNAEKVAKDFGKAKAEVDENPFTALMKIMNPPKKNKSKKPKIAIIYGVGPIESGSGGPGLMGGSSMGSKTMVKAIQEADEDETVKAIVLRVDSPGGSALASDMIWHALRKCKKPTIASMGDIAASGGYYISMGCSKVYAEPGTLTGSIGVVGGKFAIGGIYDWASIKTEVISRGANTGLLSMHSPFSPSEKKSMTALMQEIYDQFLDRTVQNRTANGMKMTKETLLPLAGGRIWTGRQAKERGLVDELGTLSDAVADARKLGKIEGEPEYLILPEPGNILDKLTEGGFGLKLDQSMIKQLDTIPEMRGHLRTLEGLLKLHKERVWLTMPYRLSIK